MELKMAYFLPVFLWALSAHGQNSDEISNSPDTNYVVIGAFSVKENAAKFTQKAKSLNYSAEFAINTVRQYYYVYVDQTGNKSVAFEKAKTLRLQSPYWDTWVFNGHLGEETIATSAHQNRKTSEDIDPSTGQSMEEVKSMDTAEEMTSSIQPEVDVQQADETVAVEDKPEPVKLEQGEKAFKFVLTSALKGKEVEGEVNMVEPKSSKKLGTYKGNQIVGIRTPNPLTVNFVCDVFGYRKVEKTVNYNDPTSSEGVSMGSNDEVVIPFDLIRLRKGDKSIMYNVYFFKDAAIMRPESRTEVNSLMEMMKENPNYRIKIHGHTNGGGAGKIIALGDDKNFFSLTGSKDGYGSSKKLSQVRAETIKEYLMAEGIDEGRMEIKAWGGKRNIYDKNHPQAQANVRVEIEILQD